MDHGARIGAALLAAVAGLGGGPVACGVAPPPERIVLIVVDTLRRDHLSCYGGETATPHMDALARRGQRFTRALASFHQTSMSMGALFTGRTPSIESPDPRRPLAWNGSSWCGLARFAEGGDECVPAALPTLAERLREAGYWTIGVASNELLYEPSGFSAGFDDWVEVGRARGVPRGPDGWRLVDGRRVNRAALVAVERRRNESFFLYVHYMDVHDYYRRPVPYARAVSAADAYVGGLLQRLEGAGLLEDALVILTSDHGENLGEVHAVPGGANHIGNPSFAEVLEVPLIVAPPVDADPSRPLRSQDLYALIQRAAGLGTPARPELPPGELYVGEVRFRTYQSGRWKSAMRREDGHFHLFDLEGDPAEMRDVAEAHPGVVREHLVRVSEIARELRTAHRGDRPLSPRERRRLRALGYLD